MPVLLGCNKSRCNERPKANGRPKGCVRMVRESEPAYEPVLAIRLPGEREGGRAGAPGMSPTAPCETIRSILRLMTL